MLRALYQYYLTLVAKGELASPGWENKHSVTFGLDVADDGSMHLLDLREEVQRKKSVKLVPVSMQVPERAIRTSGIVPNVFCDKAEYMLGIPDADPKKRDAEKTKLRFESTRDKHLELLKDVDHPAARAILKFLTTWDADSAETYPEFESYLKLFAGGAQIVFCYNGVPVVKDEGMRRVWDDFYNHVDPNTPVARCLVTGEVAPFAMKHPQVNLPGVQGGIPMVSFNQPAFCAHRREQGENAPVSEKVAYGYTTALKLLLADYERRYKSDDGVMVFWSENAESQYQDFYMALLMGRYGDEESGVTVDMLQRLADGESIEWHDSTLNGQEKFFVLSMTPYKGRAAIRFFHEGTFGEMTKRFLRYCEESGVPNPFTGSIMYFSPISLLRETMRGDEKPSAKMISDMLDAIWEEKPYPVVLIKGVMDKIHANGEVSDKAVAIIKAYYSRVRNSTIPKETLNMEPNVASPAYATGQLFAVFERAQILAIRDINTTITDQLVRTAYNAPAQVMSRTYGLYQSHLKKLRRDRPAAAADLERRVERLSSIIGTQLPMRHTLSQQGEFWLGFTAQRAEFRALAAKRKKQPENAEGGECVIDEKAV